MLDLDAALQAFAMAAMAILGETPIPMRQEFEWQLQGRTPVEPPPAERIFALRIVDKPDPASVLHGLEDQLHGLPSYAQALAAMHADPQIGRHVDRLVGTHQTRGRISASAIVNRILSQMAVATGRFAYTADAFRAAWHEVEAALRAETVPVVALAPLPHVRLPAVPVELSPGIVIDRLAEDELRMCLDAGLLAPSFSPGFATAFGGVGLRVTDTVPR